MVRDPAADLATLRAIHGRAQGGHHAEAADLAEAALADGLEHPLLLNLIGLKLEQRGQVAEAERFLRRAVDIAPGDPNSRNALGLCLMRLDRPAEALMQFESLLRLNPALPFAHASRGTALFALGLSADAEASFQRAIDLDANQGVALAGLANLASRRGAYGDARVWAEKALAVLPGYPDAVMSLASAELGERNMAKAEARVRALLADAQLGPLERAFANGLLGDVLDAKGRWDDAFAAYVQCNQELRRAWAAHFPPEASALTYVHSMIHYFDRTPPGVWKTRAPPDARGCGATAHVFLVGFPRSGTKLLKVVLEGHPHVVSLEENESLIDAIHEYMQRPEDLARFAAAPLVTLERLRASYWQFVAAAGVDVRGKTFVDENSLNTLKLPLIARLFPAAKILFACRDPRDIVLSCFRHRFNMSAPIYELLTLDGTVNYYDAVMQLSVRLSNILPLQTCLVRHEDVVTEFSRELKRICAFLGIEWDPAMGDFALRAKNRTSPIPSSTQLAKGLHTEGIGQWRRYTSHMAPVLPALQPWVKRFYYDDQPAQ